MTETPLKPLKIPPAGSLAERVKHTLERLHLDDTRGAEYLGVPVYTVRKWISGEREPGAAVARLLDVLGMLEALAPNLHQTFLVNLAPRPTRGKRATPSPADNSVMSKNTV
jgi:transcriptional regulator with XRE-family HTH domain